MILSKTEFSRKLKRKVLRQRLDLDFKLVSQRVLCHFDKTLEKIVPKAYMSKLDVRREEWGKKKVKHLPKAIEPWQYN